VESFRAYGSYTEAFQDYAKLLKDNPRYDGVLGNSDAKAFAQGLQQAGYATDPHYADKLVGVISSVRARA
jgi:flagellar protein FlgJ